MVSFVKITQMFFPLRREHALAAYTSERYVKAAQSGEEIDKSECMHSCRV